MNYILLKFKTLKKNCDMIFKINIVRIFNFQLKLKAFNRKLLILTLNPIQVFSI